jgi:hypothetical protein
MRPPGEVKWALAVASSCWALWPRAAAAQEPPATEAPSAGSTVWVHLDGPSGLRLEQDLDSMHHEEWNPVCVAPCDAWVPTTFDLRVSGGGRFPSQDFSLHPDPQQRANVSVSGGSIPLFVAGIVFAAGGGIAHMAGFDIFLSASMPGAASGSVQSPADQRTGLILMGSGAAAAVVGIVLIVMNRHSHVSGDVAPTLATQLHSVLLAPPSLLEVRAVPRSVTLDVAATSFTPPIPALSLPVLRGEF